MLVKYSHQFNKQFGRLPKKDQIRVLDTIESFHENPFDIRLKNHHLKGKLKGTRSIWAGARDLRIIYREEGDHAVIFMLRVGPHSVVYK